jgi:hypothetical protein
MAMVQRSETTLGPVAVDGRTITLVARTRALNLGGRGGAVHVWSRPSHIEVLDEDGRRHVVRVHDVQRVAMIATVVGALGYVLGVSALRRRRS